jgi:translation initiation factor 3 subunit J
LTTRRPKTVT